MGSGFRFGLIVIAIMALLPAAAEAQRLTQEEFDRAMTQLRSPSAEERVAAAELLGRRGYSRRERIAPALQQLLRNDTSWEVRASSGRALGRLATRDAVPDLVRALRDPQVEVRVVAAAALWRLPDPAAVPALLELLRDEDAAARQWGALALGVIRDRRATQPLLGLLSDRSASVRLDVIRSLGRIGDPSALSALRAIAAASGATLEERLEALSSLAMLDGPEKMDVLVRMLGDRDRRIRLRVVRALGELGDALVVPPLRRRRAQERMPDVRQAIDEALRAIDERTRSGSGSSASPQAGR